MRKVALVTGGSRGIGKEIAIGLGNEGYDVVLTYNSNNQAANEVVQVIKQIGVNALAVKGDMSKKEDVDKLFSVISDEFGSIDILVNNAGITKDNLLMRMSEEDWDLVMDVNLKSVYLTTKSAIRGMMKKRYGKIINISSVVGVMGNSGQGNYSASKAGIIGFTKSMAKELASRGIRVNAIAPGFIKTEMTEKLTDNVKEMMIGAIPLGYFADPKDVSNLVNFLASERSDYITGQVIQIDGGMNI